MKFEAASSLALFTKTNAEAEVASTAVRKVTTTQSGANILAVTAPRAASANSFLTLFNARRIDCVLFKFRSVPIQAPFEDVAVDIVEPPRIDSTCAGWLCVVLGEDSADSVAESIPDFLFHFSLQGSRARRDPRGKHTPTVPRSVTCSGAST